MNDYQPNMSALPSWMPGASMGLGALGDIMSFIQNQRASNRQRDLYNLLQNPQALAAKVNSMYQPLSAEGQANVSRQVQQEMAMRGEADSRYADLASARAFSEIDTQRRNAVMQSYLQALSGSSGLTGDRSPMGGLGNALQQVMLLHGLSSKQGPASPTGMDISPGPDANSGANQDFSSYGAPSPMERSMWGGGVT
ncbi:MAG: hypothetical protein D4R44_08105 [Actinobacteria bacterium]|nr:MAG: hypothetical protein D4R44_08105 [Actinomycetota bacterium]